MVPPTVPIGVHEGARSLAPVVDVGSCDRPAVQGLFPPYDLNQELVGKYRKIHSYR